MTDVKRLLEEATPLPWYVGYNDGSGVGDENEGAAIVARDHEDEIGLRTLIVPGGRDDWGLKSGIREPADAALIVHAVNSLPAYEAAVEALERISEIHCPDPDGGQGYTDDGYRSIDPACLCCGTSDEYAVPWPCATRTETDAVLRRLREKVPA